MPMPNLMPNAASFPLLPIAHIAARSLDHVVSPQADAEPTTASRPRLAPAVPLDRTTCQCSTNMFATSMLPRARVSLEQRMEPTLRMAEEALDCSLTTGEFTCDGCFFDGDEDAFADPVYIYAARRHRPALEVAICALVVFGTLTIVTGTITMRQRVRPSPLTRELIMLTFGYNAPLFRFSVSPSCLSHPDLHRHPSSPRSLAGCRPSPHSISNTDLGPVNPSLLHCAHTSSGHSSTTSSVSWPTLRSCHWQRPMRWRWNISGSSG